MDASQPPAPWRFLGSLRDFKDAQGDYAHGKPNPEPFLKAAEQLGVEAEPCLALEDSYNGVRAAFSAGMMTVMVPDLLGATAEMEKLCLRIVQDLHEVCALIET